jgi:hypothetical protein
VLVGRVDGLGGQGERGERHEGGGQSTCSHKHTVDQRRRCSQ